MTNLLPLQMSCMAVMLTLTVILVLARFYVEHRNALFERSRWLLVGGLLTMTIHFLVQFVFGFRNQGDDVGAMLNILFYLPAFIFFSHAQLYVVCGGRSSRKYLTIGMVGYALILLSFGLGVCMYGGLHIKGWLYLADALFFLTMLCYVIIPSRQLKRMSQRIERETGNSMDTYESYMRMSNGFLHLISLVSPFMISFPKVLVVFGPLALLGFVFYEVCFLALSFERSQVIQMAEVVEDEEHDSVTIPADSGENRLSSERVEQISLAIRQWQSECGYRDRDNSLASLARRLNMSRSDLSAYISQQYGSTFRIWLSRIRLEEAKRLMREHPDYSNEVVAMECGFSSRSQLYNIFRDSTGMTPKEWVESCEK